MVFQRTFFIYLLAIIILLKITDFEYVHARRLNILGIQNQYFYGNNVDVAINYWNYRKRLGPPNATTSKSPGLKYWNYHETLDPKNISTFKSLAKYYLLAKDDSDARKTINDFLCAAPQDDGDRPGFLKAYIMLEGSGKIHCKNGINYSKF